MLHPEWEIRCEQISVYFIYTYFCGAAYDDYVYAMAAQAVYNAYMIKLLWIAKVKEKKECLVLKRWRKFCINIQGSWSFLMKI